MIIWIDTEGNNKIFIEDSFINYEGVYIVSDNVFKDNYISLRPMDIIFSDINVSIKNINTIEFDINKLLLTVKNTYDTSLSEDKCTFEFYIKEDEMLNLSIKDESIIVESCTLPKFYEESNLDDKYPKVEVNISDCIYNMRIYINETEYIDIPWYQSHKNINDTICHILDVINYITKENTNFMNDLINHDKFILSVQNGSIMFQNGYEYKLSKNGIVLFDNDFENGICSVEYQKFFRLIIDKKWVVEFLK